MKTGHPSPWEGEKNVSTDTWEGLQHGTDPRFIHCTPNTRSFVECVLCASCGNHGKRAWMACLLGRQTGKYR